MGCCGKSKKQKIIFKKGRKLTKTSAKNFKMDRCPKCGSPLRKVYKWDFKKKRNNIIYKCAKVGCAWIRVDTQ